MKKRNVLIAIAAYIGLILLCAVIIYVVPSVKGMLVRTYIAEQGEIKLSDDVDAYIVRNETVYVASKACKVTRLAEQNVLVKAYTSVVQMSGSGLEESSGKFKRVLNSLAGAVKSTEAGTTEVPGYVSYKVDGAEAKLTPGTMNEISADDLEKYGGLSSVNTVNGKCATGDPVYKIIKNGRWYIVFFISHKDAERYYVGNNVTVKIDGNSIKAEIKSVNKEQGHSRVVLRCSESYDGFITDRQISATIITQSAKGLVLEKSSIIEKDGQKGVLVKNKLGNYIFNPICVKADDGEHCVVYQDIYMDEGSNFVETIGIYDEIVAEPSEEDIKNAQ